MGRLSVVKVPRRIVPLATTEIPRGLFYLVANFASARTSTRK